MAATKVNANWSGVAHGVNTITRVTTCQFSSGGTLASFNADTDKFPTLIVSLMSKPTFSITTSDVGLAFDTSKFATGTKATLVATLKDAQGAAGGDVLFTLLNAVIGNVQGSGQHAQFASATIPGEAYSSDGITNPLSIARA